MDVVSKGRAAHVGGGYGFSRAQTDLERAAQGSGSWRVGI